MEKIVPPSPGDPRRPLGPRDPGDAWVEGDRGKFWGRFGSAGLLAHDPEKGVLLQHRASPRVPAWLGCNVLSSLVRIGREHAADVAAPPPTAAGTLYGY